MIILKRTLIFILSSFLFFHSALYADAVYIYAFTGYGNQKPEKMVLVGKVTGIGKVKKVSKSKINYGYDSRLDKITAKISSKQGLQVGQTLFVVRKDPDHNSFKYALKIAELKVISIFKTSFTGWILTGSGYFRNVSPGDFIVQKEQAKNFHKALLLKKEGDYFRTKKYDAQALSKYKAALQYKPHFPEARFSLASIYFLHKRDLLSARNEIYTAYKEIHLVKERYDKKKIYELYNSILQEDYNAKKSSRIQKVSQKILAKWLKLSSEALSNFPQNANLHLNFVQALYENWHFYFSTPGKKARTKSDNLNSKLQENLNIALENDPYNSSVLKIAIKYQYAKIIENYKRKKYSNSKSNNRMLLDKGRRELVVKTLAMGQRYLLSGSISDRDREKIANILDFIKHL